MKKILIITGIIFYTTSLHCQKKIKFKEIPEQKDTLLVYFSHDRTINASYFKVIRTVINPLSPCLLINTEKEMRAKMKSKISYYFFGISETKFTSYTTTHIGGQKMTTEESLSNYHLTYFQKYDSCKFFNIKSKLIFLKDNKFSRVDAKNFYNLDSFSPQISPVHIAAFLRCTEKMPTFHDFFSDIGKIGSDTLFFPEIVYNRYRPSAYGVLKNKKSRNPTKYYEHNKFLVESNEDLTELFLNRYKKRKSMYLYDCIREQTFIYYIIIDVVKGVYLYIDVDKLGYNQSKWHFRRMAKRISNG
ncbi:MAG: hypothetical protein V4613_00345 [Bacteroidota bacterium]